MSRVNISRDYEPFYTEDYIWSECLGGLPSQTHDDSLPAHSNIMEKKKRFGSYGYWVLRRGFLCILFTSKQKSDNNGAEKEATDPPLRKLRTHWKKLQKYRKKLRTHRAFLFVNSWALLCFLDMTQWAQCFTHFSSLWKCCYCCRSFCFFCFCLLPVGLHEITERTGGLNWQPGSNHQLPRQSSLKSSHGTCTEDLKLPP